MSNEFRGTGNVGDQPVLKTAMVGGKPRQVTELRLFFDEYRQDSGGALEQTGGFWLDVNVWGERLAPEVARVVTKGARVPVIGRLSENKWTVTATGEERRALYLNADSLFLSLARVAEVKMKPRVGAVEARDQKRIQCQRSIHVTPARYPSIEEMRMLRGILVSVTIEAARRGESDGSFRGFRVLARRVGPSPPRATMQVMVEVHCGPIIIGQSVFDVGS